MERFTGLDDPISSTSDSIFHTFKASDSKTALDTELDMFANDLNISDVSNERITEDVEDIVSDLENLLEGSSSSHEKSSSLQLLTTSTDISSMFILLTNEDFKLFVSF